MGGMNICCREAKNEEPCPQQSTTRRLVLFCLPAVENLKANDTLKSSVLEIQGEARTAGELVGLEKRTN